MSRDVKGLVDELAEASVEARRVLSELRSELKEARKVRKEFEEAFQAALVTQADERVGEILTPVLEHLKQMVQERQDAMVAKVNALFLEQSNICMYGNKQGRGQNIFEEMRRKGAQFDIALNQMQERAREALDDG